MPDPLAVEPGEDLVAVGADLEPGTLLAAYRAGLFPMPVDLLSGFRRPAEGPPVEETETLAELEARARKSVTDATGLTSAVSGALAGLGMLVNQEEPVLVERDELEEDEE